MTILFCNIGWMKHYEGTDGEIPQRGGAYNDESVGHEVLNFCNVRGRLYGYVRTPTSPATSR